jgi:hypothetical protein
VRPWAAAIAARGTLTLHVLAAPIVRALWQDEGLEGSVYLDGVVTVVDAKNALKVWRLHAWCPAGPGGAALCCDWRMG